MSSSRDGLFTAIAPLKRSTLLHVVTEQPVLIAQVEFSIGDDRMRPTLVIASLGLIETAFLFVARRCRFDQCDSPFAAFAAQIKMSIGTGQRAFADSPFAPNHVPGFQFLAHPTLAIGMPIDVLANADHTSMMIDHDFVVINLLRFKLIPGLGDFEEIATDAIAGSHITVIIVEDRWGNHRRGAFPRSMPERPAISRRYARHTIARQLNVLSHSSDLCDDG